MTRPDWPGRVRESLLSGALDDDIVRSARRLHRRRAVSTPTVAAGIVSGVVQDGAATHPASWLVPELPGPEWDQLEVRLLDDPVRLAALLHGPGGGQAVAHLNGLLGELVPAPPEVDPTCTCDDWVVPCPHALALALAFADTTRNDPWSLLTLRGRSRDWLVVAEAAQRARRLLEQLPSALTRARTSSARISLASGSDSEPDVSSRGTGSQPASSPRPS